MKVISVCSNDWANFAYNFSEALKSVGVDSYSYCLASHPFGYEKQSEVVKIEQLKELTKDADFIVVHHSCSELLPHVSDRKIIHYAAGTKYRQGYEQLNKDFKDAVTTFIALPEFKFLIKDFHYVIGAINVDEYKPSGFFHGCQSNPLFAHYPSNQDIKGSNKILQIAKDLNIDFKYSFDRVSHAEQIKRMRACDVYIELLSDEQGGKPYGSFGITCLEAAALGKVVITQNLHSEDLYYRTYGACPVEFIKDEKALKKKIEFLLDREPGYIMELGKLTRSWIENSHSYKATGERVKNILNGL